MWRSLEHGKDGGMNKLFGYDFSAMDMGTDNSKVQLVDLSMQQKDALTVLLTGRSEVGFTDIIKRMVASRKLDFDLICLKPEVGPNSQRFSRTLDFKHTFLEDLIVTYKNAEEIRVYEDRTKQYGRHFSFGPATY